LAIGTEKEELYRQIGQVKVEMNFFKDCRPARLRIAANGPPFHFRLTIQWQTPARGQRPHRDRAHNLPGDDLGGSPLSLVESDGPG
jgi:hypothetical protein